MAFAFDVDPFRKHCLLNGLDDIGLTLHHADEIRAFEAKRLPSSRGSLATSRWMLGAASSAIAAMKIAVLPGDGIGPEIVARGACACSTCCARDGLPHRDRDRADRRRRLRRRRPSAARGDARARAATPTPCCSAPSAARSTTRCRARMRPEQGDPAASARSSACSPTCARRCCYPGARGRLDAEARGRRRARHPDHPRADRRHLLRPAARPPHERRRRARGLRHDALQRAARSSASRTSASRPRASAASKLCSVDKANVLDTSILWREVVTAVATDYPGRRARRTCTSTTPRCSSCATRSSST